MSRSYKKNPGFTDSRPHNYYKRLASKKARRIKSLPNGMGYKKAVNCQYSICDDKYMLIYNRQNHRYDGVLHYPIYQYYMK